MYESQRIAHNPAAERLRIPRRLLESDTLSEHNRARIENWVQECDNTHKICHIAVEEISPTRLVDISGSPYLVITSKDMSFAHCSKRQKRYVCIFILLGFTTSRLSTAGKINRCSVRIVDEP